MGVDVSLFALCRIIFIVFREVRKIGKHLWKVGWPGLWTILQISSYSNDIKIFVWLRISFKFFLPRWSPMSKSEWWRKILCSTIKKLLEIAWNSRIKNPQDAFRSVLGRFAFPPLPLFDLCNYLPRWLGMCDAIRQPRYEAFEQETLRRRKSFVMWEASRFGLQQQQRRRHIWVGKISNFSVLRLSSLVSRIHCARNVHDFLYENSARCAHHV